MAHRKARIIVVVILSVSLATAWILHRRAAPETVASTSQASPAVHQHLLDVTAHLPTNTGERRLVLDGQLGNGVRQHWMDSMRDEGVKTVRVEVYLTWFLGPHLVRPVRVIYYSDYGVQTQIVDAARLTEFRSIGLEEQVKVAAKRYAPGGVWMDLPHSIFIPFSAATTVTLFDDEWLPIPPRMFTTFGPGRAPLIAAIGEDDEAEITRILSTGRVSKVELNEALFYSCAGFDPKLMPQLLQAGADPNVYVRGHEVYTPLMTAVWDGSSASVRTLVAAGAKVNGTQGEAGETPLTLAARGGTETAPIIELLLDAGADVNAATESGLTSLMFAMNRQPSSSIRLLISHGANVDVTDRQGRTALLFASEWGNAEAVRVLLEHHSDVNVKAQDGDTPLSVAHNAEVAALLREAGAQ